MAATALTAHRSGTYWPGLVFSSIEVNETPLTLTGSIATFQVRANAKRGATLLDYRSDGTDPQITISTAAPGGPITVAAQDALEIDPGNHVWEAEVMTSDGKIRCIGYGTWEITQDIVRRTYD